MKRSTGLKSTALVCLVTLLLLSFNYAWPGDCSTDGKNILTLNPIVLTSPFHLIHSGLQENRTEEVRRISVRLLADEEFSAIADGKKKIERVLEKVSAEFVSMFALEFFSLGWGKWKSADEARTVEELAEWLDSPNLREKADILMAITGQKGISSEHSGLALLKAGIVVLVYTPDEKKLKNLIKHELGHIFGAVHVPFPGSVMACGQVGEDFDEFNRQIVYLGRQRVFSPSEIPFSPEVREKLEHLYLKIRAQIKKSGSVPSTRPEKVDLISLGRINPCLSDCYVMLAQLSVEKRQYQKALEYLEEAYKINPDDLEILNLRAICLRRMGEFGQAVELYQKILKKTPDKPQVLYNLGIALSKMNRLVEAEQAYLKAIKLKPYFAEAHNNLGEVYLKMDRLSEAEAEFLRAVELNEKYALAISNLAEVNFRKKNWQLARIYADKALELNPNLSSAHNIKGNLFSQEGKLEEAFSEYQKALAANPDYEKAYYNLGVAASDLGRWTEAEGYFLKALRLNPYFAEAYAALGLCYLRQGRWDEAILQLNRAAEKGYHQVRLFVNLSYAYMNKKDWEKAEQAALEAIRLDPAQVQAYNNLGISLAQQGKLEEARQILARALSLDPLERNVVLNLAMVELSAGNLDKSLELFLKAIALKPDDESNAQVYHQVGLIYFRKGDYEKSWEFCLKALQSGARVEPDIIDELRKKIKK
ncbi:MAG: tetratricopeptide repeat protein [Candidatus Aminicenantes bacterium]|nr:tetratricopeptide repeat protein [Candidatus Aminicenantes bacterium]